jgi:hypothetical protein
MRFNPASPWKVEIKPFPLKRGGDFILNIQEMILFINSSTISDLRKVN